MADKKKYYIRVPEACVEVSEDVYKAFWSMDRHIRTLEEKDARNHVFSYDAFDTDDMLGAELFPDKSTFLHQPAPLQRTPAMRTDFPAADGSSAMQNIGIDIGGEPIAALAASSTSVRFFSKARLFPLFITNTDLSG